MDNIGGEGIFEQGVTRQSLIEFATHPTYPFGGESAKQEASAVDVGETDVELLNVNGNVDVTKTLCFDVATASTGLALLFSGLLIVANASSEDPSTLQFWAHAALLFDVIALNFTSFSIVLGERFRIDWERDSFFEETHPQIIEWLREHNLSDDQILQRFKSMLQVGDNYSNEEVSD